MDGSDEEKLAEIARRRKQKLEKESENRTKAGEVYVVTHLNNSIQASQFLQGFQAIAFAKMLPLEYFESRRS